MGSEFGLLGLSELMEAKGRCTLCMRACGVNRAEGERGYCNLDEGLYVASVCRHYGEEPMLGGSGGVCNVFFAHCTLQCPFCQNHQISSNREPAARYGMGLWATVEAIRGHLDMGCDALGFVTPTAQAVWVVRIVEALRVEGYRPRVIYNTNGLDSETTVRMLEGVVDVYLPDYKYGSYSLAQRCGGLRAYPEWALDSIAHMVRQVGELSIDAAGLARRGVLVRHLVLPGEVENSRAALLNLCTEFGPGLALSLMGQYTPTLGAGACGEAFLRPVTEQEYGRVLAFAESLGFEHIVCQDLASVAHYMPDFTLSSPFDD